MRSVSRSRAGRRVLDAGGQDCQDPADWRVQPSRRTKRIPAWLGGLALAAASVALTVGLFEIGFRLAGFSALHDVYSKPALLWRHDDLLGWSHEPGASAENVGPRPFPIEYRTWIEINSLGLRGPEIGPKPEGGYRILVLGDSLVAAFEVEQAETVVAQTERRLRKRYRVPIEVINAGVRGYGTDQSYLYFRERGWQLEPDLVVFSHSRNDPLNNVTLHRIRRPFGKAALRPVAGGSLEAVGMPIEPYHVCSSVVLDADLRAARNDGPVQRALCRLQISLADHSALFSAVVTRLNLHSDWIKWLNERVIRSAVSRAGRRLAGALPLVIDPPRGRVAPPEVQYRLTAKILRALADEVERRGAAFLWLMSRPEQAHLDLAWPELQGLSPVSLEGTSWQRQGLLHFRNDSHYTAAGHRFWTDLLLPELVRVMEADRPELAEQRRR